MELISLTVGLAVVLAQPEQAAEVDLQVQVRTLVEQLKSDQFDQREAARAELIALGPKALPHLPKVHAGTDAELREAIIKIRSVLEAAAAKDSLKARLVNLDVTDTPLLDVLNDITQQTGNPIIDFRGFRGQPQTSPKITAKLKNVPFWKAVDEVLAKAGMMVYPYAIDQQGEPLRGVAFVDGAGQTNDQRVVAYSGAFRFEPLHVIARRGLRNPSQNGLELSVEAAWEPRLVPISMKVLYDAVQAVDDSGREVALVSGGQRDVEFTSGSLGSFPIRFQLPAGDATKLKSITGKIESLIPAGEETFTFKKLAAAKNQQQKKAGATVILQAVRKRASGQVEDDLPDDDFVDDVDDGLDDVDQEDAAQQAPPAGSIWEVYILVQFDSEGERLESHRMDWVTENEAYLVDAGGDKVEWSTIETTHEGERGFGIAYVFGLDDDIAGYRFEYKTPVSLLKREIPFEFSDIPLP